MKNRCIELDGQPGFPAPTRELADALASAAASHLRQLDNEWKSVLRAARSTKERRISNEEQDLRDALASYLRTQ